MFDDFELIDVIGGVIILFLVASLIVVITAAPEVSQKAEPPDSNWSIERVNDTHMKIQHEGGSPVHPDNLTVIIDEFPRNTDWVINGSDGLIREGDYATIETREGRDISLYWAGEEGVKRARLAGAET